MIHHKVMEMLGLLENIDITVLLNFQTHIDRFEFILKY